MIKNLIPTFKEETIERLKQLASGLTISIPYVQKLEIGRNRLENEHQNNKTYPVYIYFVCDFKDIENHSKEELRKFNDLFYDFLVEANYLFPKEIEPGENLFLSSKQTGAYKSEDYNEIKNKTLLHCTMNNLSQQKLTQQQLAHITQQLNLSDSDKSKSISKIYASLYEAQTLAEQNNTDIDQLHTDLLKLKTTVSNTESKIRKDVIYMIAVSTILNWGLMAIIAFIILKLNGA